jgi:pyridoxal 5'-phosphate synthase pdxT subunit
MKIGVLALQGDFDAHRRRLEELGAEVVLVKKPEQLNELDGLVIPGGESGTFLKLLGEDGFAQLKDFVLAKPTFGTCAGCILLATDVENPKQAGWARSTSPCAAMPMDARSTAPFAKEISERAHRNGLHPRAKDRARGRGRGRDRNRGQRRDGSGAHRARTLAATFHPELSDDPAHSPIFSGSGGGQAWKTSEAEWSR